MRPPFRGSGVVEFQVVGGWVLADTGWINIRRKYEQLEENGVHVDPWREKATTWNDIWG